MKHLYLLFLFVTTFSFAQAPSNYYDTATGSGYILKTQLRDIITAGHSDQGYAGLWTGYATTDRDNYYEFDNTILDIYSEFPSGADNYNYTYSTNQCGNYSSEGDCYNREHLVPQSSFSEASPMKNDIHHVYPTDGYVNGGRGSFPFGEVQTASNTYQNGSQKGTSAVLGYSGTVFEPIDEFKGDIARALLYFAVRYQNDVDTYTSFDMFNGTEDQVFQTWAIDLLLDWHNVDPVSQKEIDRNDTAYNFQGNANPFVNHPEYANMIWNLSPDTQAPTTPTNLVTSNPSSSTMDLSWTASTDNTGVTSYDVYVDGSFYVSTNSTSSSYTVTGLTSETTYSFTILAKDAANNMSVQSTAANGTTTAGSGGTVDLFISEYVEGGNNKAIEIANFTGSIVNLSSYTIARDVNSGGSWGTELQLTGSVPDQDVHVIVNGSATTALTSLADQLSSADAMLFNGNDPVGLFKNGILIDVFGNLGGTDNFEDIVYRRKPTVETPNTTFNLPGEWDQYPVGTYSDIGMHTQTLSIQYNTVNELNFYPNPLKGNKLYIDTNQSLNIEIFNILGKRIISDEVNSNKNYLNLSDLNSGIYLIKISNSNQTITKKLIRQ